MSAALFHFNFHSAGLPIKGSYLNFHRSLFFGFYNTLAIYCSNFFIRRLVCDFITGALFGKDHLDTGGLSLFQHLFPSLGLHRGGGFFHRDCRGSAFSGGGCQGDFGRSCFLASHHSPAVYRGHRGGTAAIGQLICGVRGSDSVGQGNLLSFAHDNFSSIQLDFCHGYRRILAGGRAARIAISTAAGITWIIISTLIGRSVSGDIGGCAGGKGFFLGLIFLLAGIFAKGLQAYII